MQWKEKTFKNITENVNVLVCIWAFNFLWTTIILEIIALHAGQYTV